MSAVVKLPWSVVLASSSPRRLELLPELVPDFEVLPAEIAEDDHVHEDPWLTAQRLARLKALAVFDLRPDRLVIGADTVVGLEEVEGWTQLMKPADEEDAKRMLGLLQGRTHTVVTGVCLRWPKGMSLFTEATRVTFRPLKPGEIDAYVATGEPMDKAGAYGLQGAAHNFVARIEGSKTNVIGLPMERLREALEALRA